MTTALPPRRRLRHALAIPNLLTYGRLVAVPVVALFLQSPSALWQHWAALGVYTIACVTDFFDGYLARIWKQQSPLGRMLDPIADKLLVAATLLSVTANGTLSGWTVWPAIIILCRELLVSGLREYLADVKVVLPGTIKTGDALLWVAAALTLYTAVDYVLAGWPHMGEEDNA